MGFDKQSEIRHPLARSERLVIQNVGDEIVAYDEETKTAHALKPVAAAVFMYADGKNTPAEIAELASYRLDQPVSVADVNAAVAELDSCGLLQTPQGFHEHAISRRTALKAFAVTGAGTMLVSSVAAPAAFAGTTGNGKPYLCGTNNSPIVAEPGYSLNPPASGGWPQADVGGSGAGAPAVTGKTKYYLGDGCIVQPKTSGCGCTWTVNGQTYTNSYLSDTECTSGFCVKNGTVESSYTNQAECTSAGVCTLNEKYKSVLVKGAVESYDCPTSDNTTIKGICYTGSKSSGYPITWQGNVPLGTSNPGQYCSNNYPGSSFQGVTSGFSFQNYNYDWVTGTPKDQEIDGTYQCVPCDGSYDYQCCEVVCVPLTSGSPSYVQGAITDSKIPVLPIDTSRYQPSGSYGDGYGIYDTFYNWSGYPNKWCTGNHNCNPGKCS